MCIEIGALWKVLAQQSVGVFVGTALPRTVRIAEVDLHACIDLQTCVLSQLSSLIPRQRPPQLLRQSDDHSRGAVRTAARGHATRKRGRALHMGPDRRSPDDNGGD